ncbi:MAG TPA: ribonuclease HII [Candidatus Paceibacterota bacterium]
MLSETAQRCAIKYLIGIDEVGRGPLAGPFTVGAVAIPFGSKLYLGAVKDSKQLLPEDRDRLFRKINALRKDGKLRHSISHIAPHVLDKIGLTKSAHSAVARSLKKLKVKPDECLVLLDGGLRAPNEFLNQRTVIKGDEKIKIIALASIVAKVTRDRTLIRLSKKYPEYDFHVHKGYGTKRHYERLRLYGPCEIHRKLFLRKFFESCSTV